MTLYRGKYRIESTRQNGWNYASEGCCFLTICTYQRECIFGKIIHDKMELSDWGVLVKEELVKSFEIRTELECLCHVIMPNHLHLIVKLNNPEAFNSNIAGISRIQPKSIASFVGGFKSAVTTRINGARNTPFQKVWQSRFYDHVIKGNSEFLAISTYISDNPSKWVNDLFNK